MAHCVGHLYRYILPDVSCLFYLLVILSRKRFRNFEIQKLREKYIRNKTSRRSDEKYEVFDCSRGFLRGFFLFLFQNLVQFLFFYLSSTSNISSILSLFAFSFVLISISFLRLRNAHHNFFGIIEKDQSVCHFYALSRASFFLFFNIGGFFFWDRKKYYF